MAKPRGFETVRDMVMSMAVVGAVVAGLFLVVVWQRPEVQGSIRPVVDVSGLVDQVDVNGPFHVQEPTNLPAGWTPNSAWFDTAAESGALNGSVLHLGYVTPSDSYAEVKQTDGDAAYAIDQWADAGIKTGTVELGGNEWTQLESQETGTKALVIKRGPSGSVLTLVTGKADWPELEQLAKSLQ